MAPHPVEATCGRPGDGPAESSCPPARTGTYPPGMPFRRWRRARAPREPAVAVGDPRLEGWESVSSFADRDTAVAWRDHLRAMGVDACCVADHPLDRSGRGDIYLVVPPEQWSRANEITDNLP